MKLNADYSCVCGQVLCVKSNKSSCIKDETHCSCNTTCNNDSETLSQTQTLTLLCPFNNSLGLHEGFKTSDKEASQDITHKLKTNTGIKQISSLPVDTVAKTVSEWGHNGRSSVPDFVSVVRIFLDLFVMFDHKREVGVCKREPKPVA